MRQAKWMPRNHSTIPMKNFALFGQQITEEGFDGRVFGEIDKVINVETK
jgi:hypothetical protein